MPLPNNLPFFHLDGLQVEFSMTLSVFILDRTEEGLVGEVHVLLLDNAEEGLVGELGGRGNGWHSLLPSSNFFLGESRHVLPANRG